LIYIAFTVYELAKVRSIIFMKVLIVEDEPDMLDNMVQSLQKEKYLIESATSFDAALQKISVYEYDCVILDISLPGGSGLELLKILKQGNNSEGVIIVSAKNSLDDKILGLNLGADDYLPKPFHMAELNARVQAVFRRRKLNGNNIISIENVKIFPEERTVFINEQEVKLNRKEYDILLYLATNKNRLVQKTALAEYVWGDYIDEADSFEFIYAQIKNLRKKLKEMQADLEVQAVYGIGYKLVGK